jgi:hypothetical protein
MLSERHSDLPIAGTQRPASNRVSGERVQSTPYQSPYQALIRLQHLRTQVADWRLCPTEITASHVDSVIQGLRGLAESARHFGTGAYAALCQDCTDRVASLCRPGVVVPCELRYFLAAWLASSDRYLRQPARAAVVADLVARFAVLCGDSELFNTTAQGALFRNLLFPV